MLDARLFSKFWKLYRFFIMISNFPLCKLFRICDVNRANTNAHEMYQIQICTQQEFYPCIFSFLSCFEARASFVRCRCSLSRARSFTHVRADVKRKAYRISRERCPESAGVSCDVR